MALATVILLAAGRVASAAGAPQPTVAELLQRIEALEKALGEVRRDAERCGESADAAPPSQRPAVTAGV